MSRGRGKQRVTERKQEDPKVTNDNSRTGKLHRYHHPNWRENHDITTFYFTRFPEHTKEKDLWAHFKKWGDVREIFIPSNRNKGGRRYGFARFKGVQDERTLERRLDNIMIDGLKLYVNLPKYGRRRVRIVEHNANPRILTTILEGNQLIIHKKKRL